jgi:hypothetical protein
MTTSTSFSARSTATAMSWRRYLAHRDDLLYSLKHSIVSHTHTSATLTPHQPLLTLDRSLTCTLFRFRRGREGESKWIKPLTRAG